MHDQLSDAKEMNQDNSIIEDGPSTEAPQDSSSANTRWKKGDPVKLLRVRFPGNAKSFPFLYGKRIFQYGQKVVATSDRGMTVGYINSFPYTAPFQESMLPIKSILRAATKQDIEEQKSHFDSEKKVEILARQYINELKLDMIITHVEIIQFGKKAVIYFTAPARVDFRSLVRKLVSDLKMRIELRQISVRDRSAAVGSIGACGLLTCCSGFLKNYGHVSIKLAKLQNLALIPSKINGVCGQLKCCITYEEKVYTERKSMLPEEGKYYQLENGDRGKVTKTHLLIAQFEMLTDQGKFRRYSKDLFNKSISLPKSWKFPERFDHIVNETSQIIGLTAPPQERFEAPLGPLKQEVPTSKTENEESPPQEQKDSDQSKDQDDLKKSRPNNKNRNRNRNKNRNRDRNKASGQNKEKSMVKED